MLTVGQALEEIPEWSGLSDEEKDLLERLLSMLSAEEFKNVDPDDLIQLRKAMVNVDSDIPKIAKLKNAIRGLPASKGCVGFI